MRRALVLVAVLAYAPFAFADGFAPPSIPFVTAFSQLPTTTASGSMAYVTDCRAIASVSGLALVTQAAGAGTGCLATFNGSVWQIDGTTIPVAK